MSLYKYENWASMIAQELKTDVEDSGADSLRDELVAMGEEIWLRWVQENEKHIFDVLGATPKQRAKRKYWSDIVLRRRLCFAAYNKALLAAHVLYAAEQISPGGSYRSTCQHAAYLGDEILTKAKWCWPFESSAPFKTWEMPCDSEYYALGSGIHVPGQGIVTEYQKFYDSTEQPDEQQT